MKRKIELLAPGGNIDSIKTAILAGADAVYCGLNKFNARNRAANINFENLQGILRLAHKHDCEVFLTLNIIIVDSEIPALIKLLNKLVNTKIDGVIVQDLGLFYLLSKHFKELKIHASTQCTTHNKGQIQFLEKLNVNRVNLSRELNINEIKSLTSVAKENNILTEVFVHGSYCISFSGICYMSSVHGGNSGNRGRCSQPCRDKFVKTPVGIDHPLNLKDNSAYFDLEELYDAGVYSLKIEGRIKEFDYVYTVVNTWKKQIHSFCDNNNLITDNSNLFKVFNRDFTNSFLKGNINKDMFIDNPMSYSSTHLSEINNYSSENQLKQAQIQLYREKEKLRAEIKNKIDQFNIDKIPLEINISGQCGIPLKISVKTPNTSFDILSETNLKDQGTEALDLNAILSRLKAVNETEYFLEHSEFNLDNKLYLPFKELTSIKKRLLFVLNGSKPVIAPVNLPSLKRHKISINKPKLSVLISSKKDISLCNDPELNVYFQLPNSFKTKSKDFIDLFKNNLNLTPWFPSVLIGDDYLAAIEFLEQIQPKQIVTNNTGIAFEAYKKEISWIAGPSLNLTNSYALKCLKETFNCSGAFLSNEISKQQMIAIKKPEEFHLYYSIYHPIVLMTSRQCLFHQVSGCEKNKIDDSCIQVCEKNSTITSLNKTTFMLEKAKGNYHTVYNASNVLNLEVISDFPQLFSGYMIDLRDVTTETKLTLDTQDLTDLFNSLLKGNTKAKEQLKQSIFPTINTQYKKGI